jgi:hypothetical protein
MRGVSLRDACGAGLLALAGAGLWGVAGCGVVVDEPQLDTRAEQRPGTWVRRLETEISKLRGAYDDMVVRATPAQRRRLPSIGSELSRLADAAASMKDDLEWKRGRFGEHLQKAESVATSIDQQLTGAPVTQVVKSAWWDTGYALGFVREFYRTLGPERLYQAQEDPRGVVKLASPSPKTPGYDASPEIEPALEAYEQVMEAWRDAPARRGGTVWAGQLDRGLTALGGHMTALAAGNPGDRAAVASAAERVRQQAERVGPLVAGNESRLPPAMVRAWGRLSTLVPNLGKP